MILKGCCRGHKMSRHWFGYPNECKFRQLNCMKDLHNSQDLGSAALRTSPGSHQHVTHFAGSCADEHQLWLLLVEFCFATHKWGDTCRADGVPSVPSKQVHKVHQFDLVDMCLLSVRPFTSLVHSLINLIFPPYLCSHAFLIYSPHCSHVFHL